MILTMLLNNKNGAEPRSMRVRKLKMSLIVILTAVLVFLLSVSIPTNLFSANGTSIAMVNRYPVDGEIYAFVDHFLEQITAVNTNTTISISIDDEPFVPMDYQGIRNEIVTGDNVARDWHTWTLTVPAITTPGTHKFRFFKHYYVWQEADRYWAEFNVNSTVMSFTIAGSSLTPSPSPKPLISPIPTLTGTSTPSPTLTTTATPSTPPEPINPIFTITVITGLAITVFSVFLMFTLRKRNQKLGI